MKHKLNTLSYLVNAFGVHVLDSVPWHWLVDKLMIMRDNDVHDDGKEL